LSPDSLCCYVNQPPQSATTASQACSPLPHNKGKKTREVEAMEVELKKKEKTFLEAKFF
jgi:hypothetical protein